MCAGSRDAGPGWEWTLASIGRPLGRALTAVLAALLLTGPADAQPRAENEGESDSRQPRLRVRVEAIRVSGNTVFDDALLRERVTGRYEGRWLDAAALQALQAELTRFYVSRGYVNSGAVLPDQTVADGILDLRVVEGSLERMEVTGNRSLLTGWIEERLRQGLGDPLNANALFQSLSRLQTHDVIDRVDGRLAPGSSPGRARLRVSVEEAPKWQAGLTLANDRAPGVGETRTTLSLRNRSLTGRGDPLELSLGLGRTSRDMGVIYTGDPGANGWHGHLLAERGSASVVESPFDALDIRSRTARLFAEVRHERRLGPTDTVRRGLGLDVRESRTWLLGEPFSFSEGSIRGRARSTALQLSQDWLDRRIGSALAVRLALRVGLDAFGATTEPAARDTHFLTWQGQLQYARRLSDPASQLILRFAAQAGDDRLPAIEQFSLGGIDSVRGYRENRLIRDTGFSATAELRHRVASLRSPFPSASAPLEIQAVGFVDFGRVRADPANPAAPRRLRSIGIGLRVTAAPALSAELSFAHALDEAAAQGSSSQDRGIHLRVSLSTR